MLFVVVCANTQKNVGNRPPQSWRGAQKAAGRALVEKASRWVQKWNKMKTNCNKGVINSLVKSIACCANSSSTSNRHNRLFLHLQDFMWKTYFSSTVKSSTIYVLCSRRAWRIAVSARTWWTTTRRGVTPFWPCTLRQSSKRRMRIASSLANREKLILLVSFFLFLCFIFMTLNYQLEVIFSLGLSHVMDSRNIKSSHKGEKLPKL